VYRGIRGELPEAFWLRDALGFITAVDFGFMSTSLDRVVSESFLGSEGTCVLWKIECAAETDDGFHCAADVSLLSQFPAEKEMLFPPLTMLQVVGHDHVVDHFAHHASCRSASGEEISALSCDAYKTCKTAKGAEYICITVRPTFI
jgi:hypothetical protein